MDITRPDIDEMAMEWTWKLEKPLGYLKSPFKVNSVKLIIIVNKYKP